MVLLETPSLALRGIVEVYTMVSLLYIFLYLKKKKQ